MMKEYKRLFQEAQRLLTQSRRDLKSTGRDIAFVDKTIARLEQEDRENVLYQLALSQIRYGKPYHA